jgi:hypothetical protein
LVLFIFLLVQLSALFICNTRGTLALTLVGFLVVILPMLLKKGLLRSSKIRYGIYGFFFLCMSVPLFVWDDYFWSRITNPVDVGVTSRVELYKSEAQMIKTHPLFGCGVGNFVCENIPKWPEEFRKKVGAFFLPRNAESDFLEAWTETGTLGFAFYCFFLFGAIVLGLCELRRAWQWESYILLVLFMLMLINGLYDTSIRRFPCAVIFWGSAGYFWRNKLCAAWQGLGRRTKFSTAGFTAAVHCVLLVFFLRLLLGDFYYQQSFVTAKNGRQQSGKYIEKSLAACPFHPDALFEAAYIGIQTNQYEYTKQIAIRLDKTSPHYRPIAFLLGQCALGEGRDSAALAYADEEIERNPNFFEAFELKALALSRLGKCKEFFTFRDSLCLPLKDEKAFTRWGDTISGVSLKQMYIQQTGKIRAFLGGTNLREGYRSYVAIQRQTQEHRFEQLHRIALLKCKGESEDMTTIKNGGPLKNQP